MVGDHSKKKPHGWVAFSSGKATQNFISPGLSCMTNITNCRRCNFCSSGLTFTHRRPFFQHHQNDQLVRYVQWILQSYNAGVPSREVCVQPVGCRTIPKAILEPLPQQCLKTMILKTSPTLLSTTFLTLMMTTRSSTYCRMNQHYRPGPLWK